MAWNTQRPLAIVYGVVWQRLHLSAKGSTHPTSKLPSQSDSSILSSSPFSDRLCAREYIYVCICVYVCVNCVWWVLEASTLFASVCVCLPFVCLVCLSIQGRDMTKNAGLLSW